jgi:LysM repeat protein
MRLTRFGRLVVAVLLAAVLSVLAVGLAGQLAAASGEPRVITVQSGQTLSGIAARELPDLSIADGVVELQIANALSTTHVHTGQRLVIPTR